jgi:hypothetical protein
MEHWWNDTDWEMGHWWNDTDWEMGHWWNDTDWKKTENTPSKAYPPTATLLTTNFTQTALVLNPGRRRKRSGLTA